MANNKTGFANVRITLEHDIDEQYQYQPGEILRGKIGIFLHRSTLVRSVFISIHGESVCSWDESWGAVQSSENYIDATQIVYDASQGPTYLEQGYQDFPFSYQLPDNIPSSFIGKFGSITYILKAVVQGERPGETSIASEPFLVMQKSILPEKCFEPYKDKVSKTFMGMCSVGKVKASIELNQTGFVPGDDMNIQAEIHNRSPLRVTAVQAALIMHSIYHAQKNVIPFRQIINKVRDDTELSTGDGRRWNNARLSIPAYIPESNLRCCDIIELSYLFQFRIEMSSGKELRIEFPIIIGANPKGLEVPDHPRNDVNIHWTMGPRDLAKIQHEEKGNRDEWQVKSPEFRADQKVKNPLYRSDSHVKNGDVKHGKLRSSQKEEYYDEHDRPNTRL